MKTKICFYCRNSFLASHGNSNYCPGKDCENEARKQRSKERYASVSTKADPLWLNEKILRELYHKYDSTTELEPNKLEALGFDFDLVSEERNVNEVIIYCMRNFGYSFLINKSIQIWKLK